MFLKQLKQIIVSGIWKDIKRNKGAIQAGNSHGILSDITDGRAYRELLSEGQFLSEPNNITVVMNTDGVNLYSSSKVELWPIFLALNEMSPATRFARDNMILVGIWQGKGKPPFTLYLDVFSKEMNSLRDIGTNICIGSEYIKVKIGVVVSTLDLPAKAAALNMSLFNGAQACITCEEPGKMVTQGKGHARCYPYRSEADRYPLRTSDNIKREMASATDRKRVKGFRGISGLVALDGFDLVRGIVPDYMHGLLLGITKNLLGKWFSPTQSGRPYFVGKELKTLSKCLCNISPPDFIERLPRDLEKHYSHFKATELQAWLLYYGVPCLMGILPNDYLDHFAKLSEASFILLGDCITTDALSRADKLMDEFYAEFSNLYGEGSCGLNVHNAGVHLAFYVAEWGPVWAWSCFAFEDSNAVLLQAVHGTGNVVNQIMRFKQAQAVIRKFGHSANKKWTKTKEVVNCCIAGKEKPLPMSVLAESIMEGLRVQHINDILKVDRVLKGSQKFYSADYTRMKRRICNTVLLDNDRLGSVKHFVMVENVVYAVVSLLNVDYDTVNQHMTAGKHLIPVRQTNETVIVMVEELLETVLYIKCRNDSGVFISRMPNKHGHSVFK